MERMRRIAAWLGLLLLLLLAACTGGSIDEVEVYSPPEPATPIQTVVP